MEGQSQFRGLTAAMLATGVPVEATRRGGREVARKRGLGHRGLLDDDGQGSDPCSRRTFAAALALQRGPRR